MMITSFKKLCQKNANYCELMTGVCKNCPKKGACKKDLKDSHIINIKNMDSSQTRYPIALKFAQRIPILLYIVPEFVYEKMYGSYVDYLPCPFKTSEILKNIEAIEKVYEKLDSSSKEKYLNLLLYRLTFERRYIQSAFSEERQYFIEPYRSLSSKETYVDCGAFIGDTFIIYSSYNDLPLQSYFFEPEDANIKKLRETLKPYNEQMKYTVIPKGVYDHQADLWFVGGNESSSYLSEKFIEGAVPLKVTSIDEEISEPVTFIKMDIEGSELKALHGAHDTIRKYYPKLAICIYHSINDLWDIPLYIMENFPEYNHFEIGHYTLNFRESVFYAYK